MKNAIRTILLSLMLVALAVSSFALESTLTLKGGVSQATTDIEEKEEMNGMIGISYEIWMAKWLSLGVYPYITRVQAGEKLPPAVESKVPYTGIPYNFQTDLVGGDLMLKIRPHWYPIAPYIMGGAGLVNFFPKTKDGNHIMGYPEQEYDYTVAVLPAVGAGLNIFTGKGIDFDLGFQMNYPATDYLEGWEADVKEGNDSYWMAWLGLSHTFGKGKKAAPMPIATLDVTPATRNVTNTAGTTDFSVMSNGLWTVTESVDWLTVAPMSGTGDAKFMVNYDANTGTYARTGEIFVIGDGISKTVKVVQDGAILKLTPTVQNVGPDAGNTTFNINANNPWTVTEDVDWLTVTPMSGTGNASFVVNYDANPSPNPRTGQITITSNGLTQVVTVVQAGMVSTLVLNTVNFEFDKSDITPTAKAILDANIVSLKNNPTVNIDLQGHTDFVGTEDYNQKLSQRRANAVKSYLVDNGIDANRLTTSAWGETKPIASNDTEEGMYQNRRVEFVKSN